MSPRLVVDHCNETDPATLETTLIGDASNAAILQSTSTF